MRTIQTFSSAAARGSILLLSSVFVFVCANQARAGGVHDLPATAPIPFYGSFGLGQESNPQTQEVSLTGTALNTNLSPETLGDLMMIHQRYLAAIEAYQRAPRDSAIIWNKLGIAYQHMYALDIAKLQYEKALSMNPKYPEALNNLGTVYYGQQNYHKAEVFYLKAIKLKPNCASFYSNLGTAYFSDHNYKRGMQAYRKAFAIDPQVFIGDPLERVAEMGPVEEQITLNYSLARLYAEAGMVEASIHYLREAFMDGFNDNKKLMTDPGFAALRKTPQFRMLLTEEHIKDGDTEQSLVVRGQAPAK